MTRRLSYRILAVFMSLVLFTMSIFTVQKKEVKGAAIPIIGAVLAALGVATAVYLAAENTDEYEDWYEYTWKPKRKQAYEEWLNANGFIPKESAFIEYLSTFVDPWQEVRIWLANHTNKSVEEVTEDECKQALYNMVKDCTINENNDTFIMSNDLRDYITFIGEDFKGSQKFYTGYTLDLQRYSLGGMYTQELQNLINQYQEDYWIFMGSSGGSSSNWKYFFVKKDKIGFIYNNLVGDYCYSCSLIDSFTFTDKLQNEGDSFYYTKPYNGSLSVKMPYSPPNRLNFVPSSGTSNDMYCKAVNQNKQFISSEIGIGPSGPNHTFIVSYGKRYPLTIYSSLSLFASVSRNESPYYESQIWKDFAGSSGTYTIDSNNLNQITYGDIVTYNNNYYDRNGQYPAMPDIQIYIDNNDPDDNDSGGGSGGEGGQGGQGGQGGLGGSGGTANVTNNNNPTFNNNPNININLGFPTVSGDTVSGNGAGSSGGVGNIFGFLSQIGKVIGELIKNIGQVLADILEGIVSVVSSLVESIPTVFGEFMGALIGWLPPELQALITLSITAMIIVGLIKLFRG